VKLILISLLLLTAVAGYSADIEKIIGKNDFIAVNDDGTNIPLRYRKVLDAFGIMTTGCTVTHLGNGIVLTAGHCFWAPPTLVEHTGCADTEIIWGVRGNKQGYLKSQCQEVIAAQYTSGLDFAIIKVSPAPDVFIAPDLKRRAIMGDSLTLFSHPDDLPLHWSQNCGVERNQNPLFPADSLQHQCDTNPGSSGATLLSLVNLKVVGIHDGGYLDIDGSGMNYGTFVMNSPIYGILKDLGFN